MRRRLTDARAEQILRFWARHGALDGAAARQRLPEVVCVLLDAGGDVAGVNSVCAEEIDLIGKRRFWQYRRFVAPGAAPEADVAMLLAAYEVLDEEHAASGGGPVGLCVLVDDPETMRRHPEAIWPDTELVYAGYLPGGRQVRIRYFTDARI